MAIEELSDVLALKCLMLGATPRRVEEAYRERAARKLADELRITRNIMTGLARRWGIDRGQYRDREERG